MSGDREERLRQLAERLGHGFSDLAILDRALTHTSWANETLGRGALHNEPLEFLGDAVLGFLVADLLHGRDPDGDEGTKSKSRAQLVAEPSLAARSAALGIPELLQLGRGEEKTGGRAKQALWADAYEAVLAAVYLDGGLEPVRRLVATQFGPDLDQPQAARAPRDAKSELQELLQGRGDPPPEYVIVAEEGPSHRRRFRVRCEIAGAAFTEGEGFSKKQAQQDAARKALEELNGNG